MSDLNVSIVGLGSIAEYHFQAFKKCPGVNLRGVMSRNRNSVARVMQQYDLEIGVQDYDELLSDAKTDAVVLCTPNDLHFSMTQKALRASKHVLVEKPLAASLKQARQLCQLARDQQRNLMVAMTARFTPQYSEAYRCIRKGEIGQIIQIAIRWFEPKTIGVNWEKKPVCVDETTSTVLYHHGAHMLDAALWLLDDKPERVHAVGSKHQILNDDVSVLIRTQKGQFITSIDSFNCSEKIHDMTVIGENGVIEIIAYEQLKVNGELRVQTSWQEGLLQQGVAAQAEEFVKSIKEERSPIASGEELLASFEALENAYSQLKEQGVA